MAAKSIHHLMNIIRHVDTRFRSQALNRPFSVVLIAWWSDRVSTQIETIECSLESANDIYKNPHSSRDIRTQNFANLNRHQLIFFREISSQKSSNKL